MPQHPGPYRSQPARPDSGVAPESLLDQPPKMIQTGSTQSTLAYTSIRPRPLRAELPLDDPPIFLPIATPLQAAATLVAHAIAPLDETLLHRSSPTPAETAPHGDPSVQPCNHPPVPTRLPHLQLRSRVSRASCRESGCRRLGDPPAVACAAATSSGPTTHLARPCMQTRITHPKSRAVARGMYERTPSPPAPGQRFAVDKLLRNLAPNRCGLFADLLHNNRELDLTTPAG